MPKPLSSPGKGNDNGGEKPSKALKNNEDQSAQQSDGIYGTEFDDNLVGTEGDDWIFGLEGDDTLNGWTGHNEMDGGEGSDLYLVYGRGSTMHVHDTGTDPTDYDVISAGTASTAIGISEFGPDCGIEEITSGGHSSVSIEGSGYADTLDFSGTTLTGIEMIHGMSGNDTIIGSDNDDWIIGGSGEDRLSGGNGTDSLNGGLGADTFTLSADDTGVDTIEDFNLSDGDTIDLSEYSKDANVTGWAVTDTTPDNGVDDPILRILYENGEHKEVAFLEGVTEEEQSLLDESILLF